MQNVSRQPTKGDDGFLAGLLRQGHCEERRPEQHCGALRHPELLAPDLGPFWGMGGAYASQRELAPG